MNIYFDMDGTIADLYGVDNWLEDLLHENTRPYAEAEPLVNLQALARVLNRLTRSGHTVNIISWTSRNGSEEYNEAVRQVKLKWLAKHLKSVTFTTINIVPYGTPKSLFNVDCGILFDDEERNREEWTGEAYDETEIFEILKWL